MPDLAHKNTIIIWLSATLVLVAFLGGYFYWRLYNQNLALTVKNQTLENTLAGTTVALASTTNALRAERGRNNQLADQINGIATTVSALDKLSKTDSELLKRYSKVSFLNENYIPSNLTFIAPNYLYNPSQPEQIHANVWPYLQRLLTDASLSPDSALEVISAYRSFGQQSSLKSSYKLVYGTGANKFSADQGYSEHQLGTAIDLTTPKLGADFDSFGKSSAYTWMLNNAYRYGFILSYPQNNTYYQFEPWHWRFVGVKLATQLHADSKYFYSLSQRTIDQYLINIFD